MKVDESHITGMNLLEGTSNPTVVQGPESGLCSALQGGWGTTTVRSGPVPLPFQDAQKLMRTGIAVTQVGVELRIATGERVNSHAVILSPSLYLRFQMPEK